MNNIKQNITLAISVLAMIPMMVLAQPRLNRNNIDAVIKAMTPKEKATILVGYTFGKAYWGLPTNPDPYGRDIVPGAGGYTGEVPRLGIPHTVLCDGPAGLRISPKRQGTSQTYYCTGFPVGVALASTWNQSLIERIGAAMGNEVREYGVDVILGPGMNLMRSPLCGRNFEYYSEDPVLTGKVAAAMVRGIQSQGVGTSVKHFAVNNQETNRQNTDAVVSQRALRELYLRGFEIALREGQPWTVMSSYNRLNGTYTQESKDLLTTILRDEWGYQGMVMTDWTNTRNTLAQVKAGNDLLMPGNKEQIVAIEKGLSNGSLPVQEVDRNLHHILEYVVKTPRFKSYKYSDKPNLKAHAALVRKAAAEGMVLLENKGVLPLHSTRGKKSVSLALFGITSYNSYAGGTGSGNVSKPYVVDLRQGLVDAGYNIDSTLTNIYELYRNYGKAMSSAEMGPLDNDGGEFWTRPRIPEPALGKDVYKYAAERCDAAVITIGRSSGEGCDRMDTDFYLGDDEKQMIMQVCNAFHAIGKKVVVVMNVGGVIETKSWTSLPDAVLLAWQPGEEVGHSVADVLTGALCPSGRLPVTFPVNLDDIPSTKNFPHNFTMMDQYTKSPEDLAKIPNVGTTRYEEDIYVGYRYFQTAHVNVSYPFGYGLSYTTFNYSDAKVMKKGNKYVVKVTITNTGQTAGSEVAQLYVSAPKGRLEKPALELKDFVKTRILEPGECQTVQMSTTMADLASYDDSEQAWITDAGDYCFLIGASVADIKAKVCMKVGSYKKYMHDVLKPLQTLNKLCLKKQ
ncbi:MAG: beta-glucosidase [Prevotella sp.]